MSLKIHKNIKNSPVIKNLLKKLKLNKIIWVLIQIQKKNKSCLTMKIFKNQ